MTNKIDFKKNFKNLYKSSAKQVVQVDVPAMSFLMIDGQGDPNISKTYAEAVEALFSVSYTLKFMIKKGKVAIDYGVLPLEGLWWADNISDFITGNKARWKWTMMIMQPEFISPELVEEAISQVIKKKQLLAANKLRFELFDEGKAAQMLHIGPFSEEGPTIEKVHQFIDDQNLSRAGKHHEIYLNDIRRAAPANWKTIIRQPMGKNASSKSLC